MASINPILVLFSTYWLLDTNWPSVDLAVSASVWAQELPGAFTHRSQGILVVVVVILNNLSKCLPKEHLESALTLHQRHGHYYCRTFLLFPRCSASGAFNWFLERINVVFQRVKMHSLGRTFVIWAFAFEGVGMGEKCGWRNRFSCFYSVIFLIASPAIQTLLPFWGSVCQGCVRNFMYRILLFITLRGEYYDYCFLFKDEELETGKN